MYRDDELAASLQIQKVEEELSAKLADPVRQLSHWRPSHLHPVVIAILFYVVVFVFNAIWGYDESAYSGRSSDEENIGTTLWLGILLTGVVGSLFLGFNWLVVRRRVDHFYSLYGPPPKNLKPTERLSILEGRLEELQRLSTTSQQGD